MKAKDNCPDCEHGILYLDEDGELKCSDRYCSFNKKHCTTNKE